MTSYGVDEVERMLEAEAPSSSSSRKIPGPVIGEVAVAFERAYSHAELDTLFMRADAPGDPPSGTKLVKVREWLQRVASDPRVDAHAIVGKLLQDFMETCSSLWEPKPLAFFARRWLRASASCSHSLSRS